MIPNNLTAALDYAANGWPVLPIKENEPRAKAPYNRSGHKGATRGPKRLCQWWNLHPGALVAIAPPPGVVVLDIDPRNGGSITQLEAITGAPIPPTLTTRTGGGGEHLYYRLPEGTHAFNAHPIDAHGHELPGIDIKGNGSGYVIAPPSIHPDTGNPYTWKTLTDRTPRNPKDLPPIPTALYRALTAKQRPTRITGRERRETHSQAHPPNPDGLIDWYRRNTQPGQRSNRLYRIACRFDEEHQPPTVFNDLETAARTLGLPAHEAARVIHNAQTRRRRQ